MTVLTGSVIACSTRAKPEIDAARPLAEASPREQGIRRRRKERARRVDPLFRYRNMNERPVQGIGLDALNVALWVPCAMSMTCQLASAVDATLFERGLAGMSADRDGCDGTLGNELVDVVRVEEAAVPLA
jgi:hypothetical protein